MNKGQFISKKLSNVLSQNSPTILTGVAVAGLIGTVGFGIKATPKALDYVILEENLKGDYLTKREIIKATWKCYIPTAILGATTIGCIIGANKVNLRRNAALASVFSITEATLKEYQSKVVETIGEKKAGEIQEEITKDIIKNNPPKDGQVILTGKGETLCLDVLSGRYFKSDIEKLRKTENDLNSRMLKDDFISLNDVYYEFGLDPTKLGDEMGWHQEDGLIYFEFSSQLADGVPCMVIDYQITPHYDYMDRNY